VRIGESQSEPPTTREVDRRRFLGASGRSRGQRLGSLPACRLAPQQRRLAFTAAVIACYLAIGLVAYWPMLPGSAHRLFSEADGDPAQTVWFFAWTAHAVVSGHNPFFTAAVNVPLGVNLAQAPGIPLLGLIALPMTLAIGPVASATTLMVAAMPLSAACAYKVLCRWRVWVPAAALGGLAYGFSPYMVAEGLLHLNLVFVPLPPLIVAALIRILSTPRYRMRWGAALAGLITAQYFISSEILAMTGVICVAALAVVTVYGVVKAPDYVAKMWRPAITALGVAFGLTAAVLAYPVWYEFAGPAHYVGPAWPSQNPWFADALDFVAPSPLQAVGPVLRAVGTTLSNYAGVEDGAYLGFAIIAVLIVLVLSERASVRVQLAACLGVISGVLSLGRYLVVDGRGGELSLPFDLMTRIPTVDNILPIRFSYTTGTCVAAVLAFGLDSFHSRERDRSLCAPQPPRRAALSPGGAFTVVVLVLIITWLPAWPYSSQVVRTLPRTVTKVLPDDNPIVLTYPYPVAPEDQAYLWQAADRFSFRLLGVYGRVRGFDNRATYLSPLLKPPGLEEFLVAEDDLKGPTYYPSPPPLNQVVNQARMFVSNEDVKAVLVDLAAPHAITIVSMFTAAFGQPQVTSGEFQLWVVDRSVNRRPRHS
jgi:hypothetical protein